MVLKLLQERVARATEVQETGDMVHGSTHEEIPEVDRGRVNDRGRGTWEGNDGGR